MTEEAKERMHLRHKHWYMEHKEQHLARQKKIREQRKASGVCVMCGKAPARAGYCDCFACALHRTEWYRGHQEWLRGQT